MNMTVKDIKALSKEEFMKLEGAEENLYDILHRSKSGYIRVEKISKNKGAIATGDVYEGYTDAFGEGLSVYIGRLKPIFRSSTIQKIDYKRGIFKTLNSVYKFTFKELE